MQGEKYWLSAIKHWVLS